MRGENKMLNAKLAGLILLTLLPTSAIVYAAIVIKYTWDIHTSVTIVGYEIAIYEIDGTTPCHEINFSEVETGSSSFYDIICKNVGDKPTNLNISTTLDLTYGTVTWNYSHAILNVGQQMPLRLNLTITNDAPRGAFTFVITIHAWISET